MYRALIKKCQRYDKDIWCGYLTSVDIVTLIDAGAIPQTGWDDWVTYARENKRKGIANPTWFYFKPNGAF